ncbi:MAG: hypothetical protein NZM37_03950 [Sandaracinaceae bacterium]|nr:hypothetical protein [Sandaracinaceae bacterium]
MRKVKGLIVSVTYCFLLQSTAGCSCGQPPEGEMDGGRRPRPDTNADVVREDALVEDVAPSQVDGGTDGARVGDDGGMREGRVECTHFHRFNEDFWHLSRDPDRGPPTFVDVAALPGVLVGVYSTSGVGTSGESGMRRIEAFRYVIGLGGSRPQPLEGTQNGVLPSIAAVGGNFLVAFVRDNQILLARYRGDLSPMGSPMVVASVRPTTPPRLSVGPRGGFLIWVHGGAIWGRMLDAMGNPMGEARMLVGASPPVQQATIHWAKNGEDFALAWANGDRPQVARLRVGALNPVMMSAPINRLPGIFTSIDLGGASARVPEGEPFAGAVVYDFDDLGYRDLVFRVFDDEVRPNYPALSLSRKEVRVWSASVAPFLSGYLLVYRARVMEEGGVMLQMGYLNREGCALGRVTERFSIGRIDAELGAVPQVAVDEGTVLILWSDDRTEYIDYWAALVSCRER